MSQPKSQLITFRGWAGKDSDISYVPSWCFLHCKLTVLPIDIISPLITLISAPGSCKGVQFLPGLSLPLRLVSQPPSHITVSRKQKTLSLFSSTGNPSPLQRTRALRSILLLGQRQLGLAFIQSSTFITWQRKAKSTWIRHIVDTTS